MKYIISKYVINERVDDKIIIWSTLKSKGFVFYYNENIEILLNRVPLEFVEIENDKVFNKLHSEGIILKESDADNEFRLLNYIYNSAIYSNTHLSITIIPTDACNFKCVYCYQSSLEKHYMSENIADRIVNMIKKNKSLKSLNISWFGGEPLCNKKIVIYTMEKINEVCKENKIHLLSQITTNASLLDLATFNKLVSLKVIFYQITIDGSKETHNLQRPYKNGQASYDDILKNIRDIQANAKTNVFKIGIRTNCSELIDREDMKEMFEDLSTIIKDDERFYFFFQWVKNWGGERIENLDCELLKDNQAIYKYGEYMADSIESDIHTGGLMQIKSLCGVCSASAKFSFIINYDGTIHKCDSAIYGEYADLNKVGYINEYGNIILDDKKNSIWIENRFNDLECRECAQLPLCNGAPCPLAVIRENRKVCNKDDEFIRILIRSFYKQGKIELVG